MCIANFIMSVFAVMIHNSRSQFPDFFEKTLFDINYEVKQGCVVSPGLEICELLKTGILAGGAKLGQSWVWFGTIYYIYLQNPEL